MLLENQGRARIVIRPISADQHLMVNFSVSRRLQKIAAPSAERFAEIASGRMKSVDTADDEIAQQRFARVSDKSFPVCKFRKWLPPSSWRTLMICRLNS